MRLTSVDELFETDASREDKQRERVLDIPLSEISDFPNHPFKVKADEAMLEMADSVKQYGILVPALVRPKADGGYEMVAGTGAKKQVNLRGQRIMPCIVRELRDDEAIVAMVVQFTAESIFDEKAFAYKMKLEAMKQKRQKGKKIIIPTWE
jgi:ParB family chromosome partitioning protein